MHAVSVYLISQLPLTPLITLLFLNSSPPGLVLTALFCLVSALPILLCFCATILNLLPMTLLAAYPKILFLVPFFVSSYWLNHPDLLALPLVLHSFTLLSLLSNSRIAPFCTSSLEYTPSWLSSFFCISSSRSTLSACDSSSPNSYTRYFLSKFQTYLFQQTFPLLPLPSLDCVSGFPPLLTILYFVSNPYILS